MMGHMTGQKITESFLSLIYFYRFRMLHTATLHLLQASIFKFNCIVKIYEPGYSCHLIVLFDEKVRRSESPVITETAEPRHNIADI